MQDPYNDHEGSGHPDSIKYIKSMKRNKSSFLSEEGTHVGGGKGGGRGPRESPKTLMTPKFKKGKVDNTIPWINLHQLDSAMISRKRICWTVIIQSLSKAKQPGLEHETSGPLQEDIK